MQAPHKAKATGCDLDHRGFGPESQGCGDLEV
jgi:hypothetical protein